MPHWLACQLLQSISCIPLKDPGEKKLRKDLLLAFLKKLAADIPLCCLADGFISGVHPNPCSVSSTKENMVTCWGGGQVAEDIVHYLEVGLITEKKSVTPELHIHYQDKYSLLLGLLQVGQRAQGEA